MAIKTLTQANLTWVNIDHIDAEALTHLRTNFNFHPLDFEDLQSEHETPKIDVYKNYIFIILQFPHWQAEERKVVTQVLYIFIGDNYLITLQQMKSKELKNFFYRCMNNRKVKADWMNSGSGYLLYRIVESLFHNTRPILNNIGQQISRLERSVFGGEQDSGVILEAARHRSNLLALHRIVDPTHYIINTLANADRPFLGESTTLYFEDVNDYVSNLRAIIDAYKETLKGMHITVESLINRRTNKIITVLTVISVGLMPINLFTGFYGMNVANLPFAGNIWLIASLLALLEIGTIMIMLVMRRRRWL